MKKRAPRSFRRESRFFLWIALLLILFINMVTLLFFRNAVAWGELVTERRAGEMLRRLSLAVGPEASGETLERTAIEPDVLFVGVYDARGRRVQSSGHGFDAPHVLSGGKIPPGRADYEWKRRPGLLLARLESNGRTYLLAMDPGPGAALRSLALLMTILVPASGAALVVLAGLYLKSLLAPYERMLETAGAAPGGEKAVGDEREFLIARFESTIAALSDKERELARLARLEKERADDLETAARTLARNLPTGLLSIDPNGTVVELNEAGREILALSHEARGEPFERLLAEIPELRSLVTRVLRDRETVERQEARWVRAGEERVLGVTATAAMGAEGRFLGVLALFTDLSEVRRLEGRVALARHLADLGEVSAGAAHEFRNAAAAIDGYADLALRHPERAEEHLKAIRREAQEMSRVTSDFLLFARPEGFSPEAISLEGVVEAAAREIESAFPEVAVARRGEFPEVRGSAVLLRRAFANLLRNAVQATPPPRRAEAEAIALEGRVNGEELAISVGDRGPGVTPANREKIFMPFYSTKPDGAGFGLAIVGRIADLHGGTVEVAARPGGGSFFILTLPAVGPAAGRVETPRA
ncbi:MAG TPA: ATP-binding protein [Thermoanaerobaculia bacterium]|nr:ATP-binding protein [Thermoanaerobaculia bacterium]